MKKENIERGLLLGLTGLSVYGAGRFGQTSIAKEIEPPAVRTITVNKDPLDEYPEYFSEPTSTRPPTPITPRPIYKKDTPPSQTATSATTVVIKPQLTLVPPLPSTTATPPVEKFIVPTSTPRITHEPPRVEPTHAFEDVESLTNFFQPNPNLNIEIMNLVDSDKRDLITWQGLIEKLARYYEWDANLAAAQMKLESDFINGLTSEQGAVGLWGIMPDINGRPSAKILMDPFYNGTWHFAIMIDVCRVQRDTLTNSLARYFAGEKEIEAGMDDAIQVLQIAGYADENGNLLIPNKCELLEEVPEPPNKSSFLNR